MRLLNVNTLKFSVFPDKSTPPYAVASHRWAIGPGDDGEITFQEFDEKRRTESIGFRKTEAFAKFVRDSIPELEWIWIDTCCINKQDAQEVTEAINSMFRWYQNSTICLAYLHDVDGSIDPDGFAASEWFRRGWTLQELLAPHTVVFLSRYWQVIGHKKILQHGRRELLMHIGPSLRHIIAKTTQISEGVLSGSQSMKDISIEERLGWMQMRETARDEDRWYCLFGIFDVAIGANYGEGGDRARRRLLAELHKGDVILDKIPIAIGAAFDDKENEHVSGCLPGTRLDILQSIHAWASGADSPSMFWLAGMAGTGKSTIFKTAMQTFKNQGVLAASFCFERGEGDRGNAKRFMTTISRQISQRLPQMRHALSLVLGREPDIGHKVLKEQFEKLLLGPLENVAMYETRASPLIIGVDALDECANEHDIPVLLDLLSKLKRVQSYRFRVLITSRPDYPIRLSFKTMSKSIHHDARLEDLPETAVLNDIRIFLRHQLSRVWQMHIALNDLVRDEQAWPGEHAIHSLAKMSHPLFIFAATICRLLNESGEDPQASLEDTLKYGAVISPLGRTYGPVLDRLLQDKTLRQRARIIDGFRKVVGPIVMLAEPLSLPALARLIKVEPQNITLVLQRLHSVLHIPPAHEFSRPIRPLHLSFCDYLTDAENREIQPFWIDKVSAHRNLSDACLHLLFQPGVLKQDLCSVGDPETRRAAVDASHLSSHISNDVSYACCYWLWHMIQSGESLKDGGVAHNFLQVKLLKWLEALGWLWKLDTALTSISDMLAMPQSPCGTKAHAYLENVRAFILHNRHVIDLAPMQVYQSAMLITPTSSDARRSLDRPVPRLWAQVLELKSLEVPTRLRSGRARVRKL